MDQFDQKSYMDKIYEFDDEDYNLDDYLEFNKFSQILKKKELNKNLMELDISTDLSTNDLSETNLSTNENTINFADLNDYVLFEIFNFLSLIELQQCRLVCKKFRILIDKIRIKKLSLSYFSNKYSWSSDENYQNLQQYSDSIDVKNLSSFEKILLKSQFQDLEHLILVTEYASNYLNTEQFELDISKFRSLKKLSCSGSFIRLKENQINQTLINLSIENVSCDLFQLFPNLVYLKCNQLKSIHTNQNLIRLDYFSFKQSGSLDHDYLFNLVPNIQILSCNYIDAYSLVNKINEIDDFLFKKLKQIKIYFNNFLSYEYLIDFLIQIAFHLKINLEFHVTQCKTRDLIKWFKFLESRRIDKFYFNQKKVDLNDFSRISNFENNYLMKEKFSIDKNNLNNINNKIYPYLFNTNCLELNERLENEFIYLIKQIPCITKLSINVVLKQKTFDTIKFYCTYLKHLKIMNTKQAFKLDLKFIYNLDHLTSIEFLNLDLQSSNIIPYKIKFSKFFQILKFRNCRSDLDYCDITKAIVEKAKKNRGKFYEFFLVPATDDYIEKFNNLFYESPENFYSNILRL